MKKKAEASTEFSKKDKDTVLLPTYLEELESSEFFDPSNLSTPITRVLDSHPSFFENETLPGKVSPFFLEETPSETNDFLQVLGASFYLLVITGNMTGLRFKIDKNLLTIGRSSSCDITLDAHDISRIHARISILPDQRVLLKDNGSTNGTFVNNEKIEKMELQEGMNIQFGKSTVLSVQRKKNTIPSASTPRISFDPLTSLYTQEYFDLCFQTEFSFATSTKTPLSLLIVDIDHLSDFNAEFGREKGDEIIRSVANKLKELLGEEDLLSRYKDEEFTVLARGTLPTRASLLAREILTSIQNMEVFFGEQRIPITVSLGVVTMHTQNFEDQSEMLGEAYERLYTAKQKGCNCVIDRNETGFW